MMSAYAISQEAVEKPTELAPWKLLKKQLRALIVIMDTTKRHFIILSQRTQETLNSLGIYAKKRKGKLG